ncbi:MAG TPA: glycosyltransferase family 4 protein [Acidobacteriota bacterium]|nr:glycosyltransferase family 4 protein [Acidobacteriota bacterium]
MRLLVVNHYAGSPEMGMELRPYYLAGEWKKMGHEVMIVAASYSHLRAHQPEQAETLKKETREDVDYLWIRTPVYGKNNVKRFVNIAVFVAKLFMYGNKIADSFAPDAVIASSTYPFDVPAAKKIARRAGARLVFEVHDLWPLSPIELGGMSKWNPFIVATQAGENFACRNADKVVSILPLAKEHLISHGMKEENFVHVPNGIPEDGSHAGGKSIPELHLKSLLKFRNEGRFIVGYFGSHAPSDDLENLLRTAGLMKNEKVCFIMVGEGPEKPALKESAEKMKLDNVAFLPFVPKSVVGDLMKEMDALYIGWKKRNLYRFGISPTKLMDYMVSGRPVINAIKAGNNLVEESGCGISAEPEDPVSLRNAVLEMMRLSDEERREMGVRGRNHVLGKYSYPKLAEDFIRGIS